MDRILEQHKAILDIMDKAGLFTIFVHEGKYVAQQNLDSCHVLSEAECIQLSQLFLHLANEMHDHN